MDIKHASLLSTFVQNSLHSEKIKNKYLGIISAEDA
jgi:hypothetical protein